MNFLSCAFLPYPEAHKFFVEYISKAYQALTDPVSRENYEKYGHPDGRQVIRIAEKTEFCHFIIQKHIKLTWNVSHGSGVANGHCFAQVLTEY